MKFIYKDQSTYKKNWPKPVDVIMEIEASDILEANKIFLEKTGIDCTKAKNVVVQPVFTDSV